MRFQNSGLAESGGTAIAGPPPLPCASRSAVAPVEFYKIDSRRLRLREWLRSTGPTTALIGWSLKWVGINLAAAQRAPCVHDWNSLEISGDELPQDVRRAHRAPRSVGNVQVRRAGIEKAARILDFRAKVSLEEGLSELIRWRHAAKKAVLAPVAEV
jgi:hypothetical protein